MIKNILAFALIAGLLAAGGCLDSSSSSDAAPSQLELEMAAGIFTKEGTVNAVRDSSRGYLFTVQLTTGELIEVPASAMHSYTRGSCSIEVGNSPQRANVTPGKWIRARSTEVPIVYLSANEIITVNPECIHIVDCEPCFSQGGFVCPDAPAL